MTKKNYYYKKKKKLVYYFDDILVSILKILFKKFKRYLSEERNLEHH